MNTKTIAEKYLKAKNIRLLQGDYTIVLMPPLLMNCCYQLYCKKIMTLELDKDAKNYRKRWKEAYTRYNRAFLDIFNEDEQEYIMDMMDRMYENAHNSIVMLKCGIMDLLNFEDFHLRDIHSQCLVCNTLAQMAQIFFESIHINRFYKNVKSNDIQVVERNSYLIANKWNPTKIDVSLSNDEKVEALVNSLIKNIVDFCKDEERNIQKTEVRQ